MTEVTVGGVMSREVPLPPLPKHPPKKTNDNNRILPVGKVYLLNIFISFSLIFDP
jgi:hypothetical protein